MSSNGIAKPEKVKNAAAGADGADQAETIKLPKSSRIVRLRRPGALQISLLDEELETLREKEDWKGYSRTLLEELRALLVEPPLSRRWASSLPREDQDYLLHWIRGWIAPDSTDLFFRAQSDSRDTARSPGRLPTESGGSGEGVELPAEPAPESERKFGTED